MSLPAHRRALYEPLRSGISRAIVHRVWQQHDAPPRRVERFNLSNDPHFEKEARDVIGLVLEPARPCAGIVCGREEPDSSPGSHRRFCHYGPACRDARHTTISARARPPGSPRSTFRMAGSSPLVSLAIAAGSLWDSWIQIEKPLPADQEVHLIMDTYCTHKSAEVQRWLKPKRRNRFYFHFTPTSSSWLNRVERFFALITGRTIRLATFHSREELERAVATPFHPGVRGS
jgi:hypothetical protein